MNFSKRALGLWTAVLLQACGAPVEAPKVADVTGSAPRLSEEEVDRISQLPDEFTLNGQPDYSNTGPGYLGRGSSESQANFQKLMKAFYGHFRKHQFQEIDLSEQLPPIRNQSCLPLCSLFSDVDLVSGSLLRDGSGLSVLHVAQIRDASSRTLTLDPSQDDLVRISQGGKFLDESSMPLDPDLFNNQNTFYSDLVTNFLSSGKFIFQKFVSPFYELDASAISRIDNANLVAGGEMALIKIDLSGLKNKSSNQNTIQIPSFKIAEFRLLSTIALLDNVIDRAMEHLFYALYDLQNPLKIGVCWEEIVPHITSYEPQNVNFEDGCGLHALLIVGIVMVDSQPYFKVRNSHGIQFGAGGYALLRPEHFFGSVSSGVRPTIHFTYIDSRRDEHLLFSERFAYLGGIGKKSLPEGRGRMISHFGGEIVGGFKAGRCTDCKNKDQYLENLFNQIYFSIERESVDVDFFEHGGSEWNHLVVESIHSGDYYFPDRSLGYKITELLEDGINCDSQDCREFPKADVLSHQSYLP